MDDLILYLTVVLGARNPYEIRNFCAESGVFSIHDSAFTLIVLTLIAPYGKYTVYQLSPSRPVCTVAPPAFVDREKGGRTASHPLNLGGERFAAENGSVYGINFQHMPELAWGFGYLWAAALPYYFFKRKGWR
jgi:hypothetical protein